MTDLNFILSANHINPCKITAWKINYIKKTIIPFYREFLNPIYPEKICVVNEKLNDCRSFKTKDILNMLNSLVDSFNFELIDSFKN